MERLGFLPITDPRQITLQAPTQPVAPLQPLAPGEVPVLYDPANYGYANPVFAAAMNKYVEDKKLALAQARAAMEASQGTGGGGSNMLQTVAIGAGVGYLIVKFLL